MSSWRLSVLADRDRARGSKQECPAATHTLPFDDPDKAKRTAKG